jgi:long-chain acyl-CoA synthetase
VYGDSLQSCLVAIVVPDAEYLKTWAPAHGIAGTTMAEWCADPKVKQAVVEDMNRVGKADKVPPPGPALRLCMVACCVRGGCVF